MLLWRFYLLIILRASRKLNKLTILSLVMTGFKKVILKLKGNNLNYNHHKMFSWGQFTKQAFLLNSNNLWVELFYLLSESRLWLRPELHYQFFSDFFCLQHFIKLTFKNCPKLKSKTQLVRCLWWICLCLCQQ
jgi:hypothetical protein